jgi:putative NADH-flavin reductase
MLEQDAVISAIGRGLSFKSENLIERSVPAILVAMQTHGIRRLMFTSAMGVGATYSDAPVMPKLFFRTLLRGIYADKAIGEQMIRNSTLEWTIVQPVQLNDGPLTKKYRAGERLPLSGLPQVSRADTAHFILDRLHDPSTIGKTLILAA